MITTHEATKYENYLSVDDLLAPMFFVRESEFLLFLHFSNCIADLRLHTFHSEDGDVELFALLPLLFLSPIRQFQNCNPGNVPGEFTYGVDYSRICPPSGDLRYRQFFPSYLTREEGTTTYIA